MKAKKNYTPSSISFSDGFLGPRGNVGFTMEYNHDKATKMIKKLIKEGRSIEYVEAGLDGDWNVNSCHIYNGNEFMDYECHDNSIWATPIIVIHFSDGTSETYPCWVRTIDITDRIKNNLKKLV